MPRGPGWFFIFYFLFFLDKSLLAWAGPIPNQFLHMSWPPRFVILLIYFLFLLSFFLVPPPGNLFNHWGSLNEGLPPIRRWGSIELSTSRGWWILPRGQTFLVWSRLSPVNSDTRNELSVGCSFAIFHGFLPSWKSTIEVSFGTISKKNSNFLPKAMKKQFKWQIYFLQEILRINYWIVNRIEIMGR